MVTEGFAGFAGRRVLLLQGPVGPFFKRLARDLRAAGATVHKINFNAGDWVFFPNGAINYRGRMDAWAPWLEATLRANGIDCILLYGDCRPIHQAAREVATRLGIELGVFEEGYIRPNYVTFERFGVNGYSKLPRAPHLYADTPATLPAEQVVKNAYWNMVWQCLLYFFVARLGTWAFPHYTHHRPLRLRECLPWIRSAFRKHWYQWSERGQLQHLSTTLSKRYYLVPLQVFNDAQVAIHARVENVEQFILEVLRSFAQHAPKDTTLVFKHHPMDRGYTDYSAFLQWLAREEGIEGRVLYIHDQHLPTLLKHALGVVVINSTVGMSALFHGTPTVACGDAVYDVPGLTFQGGVDEFWTFAPEAKADPALYRRFKNYLIANTQLNGSFYRALASGKGTAGLHWNRRAGAISAVRPLTPASQCLHALAAEADI